MAQHNHLWNDLPFAERKRLHPHMIETQILHLQQARSLIVLGHERQLHEIDGWIKNCERSLAEATAASDSSLAPTKE